MHFSIATIALVVTQACLSSAAAVDSALPVLAEIERRIPEGFNNTVTERDVGSPLVKRRAGCYACKWCGGCGNQGQCCIPICCAASDLDKATCDRLGLKWRTDC